MTTKICTKCKLNKPVNDFFTDIKNSDKLHIYCKPCSNQYSSEWAKKWIARDKEGYQRYRRGRWMKSIYGISLEEYKQLLEYQGFLCAICDGEYIGNRNFHIDHDHETGEVRGLLCWDCNVSLGKFEHNIKILERAIEYLKNPPMKTIKD